MKLKDGILDMCEKLQENQREGKSINSKMMVVWVIVYQDPVITHGKTTDKR